jgi:hypothetical protein
MASSARGKVGKIERGIRILSLEKKAGSAQQQVKRMQTFFEVSINLLRLVRLSLTSQENFFYTVLLLGYENAPEAFCTCF